MNTNGLKPWRNGFGGKVPPFFLYFYALYSVPVLLGGMTMSYALRFSLSIAVGGLFGFTIVRLLTSFDLRVAKVLTRFVLAFYVVFILASLYHWLLYKQYPGLYAFYALLDTYPKEARGYLEETFVFRYFLVSVVAIVPLVLLGARIDTTPLAPRLRLGLLGIAIGIVSIPGTYTSIYSNNPIIFSFNNVIEAHRQKNFLRSKSSYLGERVNSHLQGHVPANVHIVVIGESLNKHHMQIYGYERPTTPHLNELRSDYFLLDHACTRLADTVSSMLAMLTLDSGSAKKISFIRVLRAAGYKVTWISNQQAIGDGESFVSLIAAQADTTVFLNKRGWTEGVSLDEKVLPEVEKEITTDGDKIVFVHLIGSHTSYATRYPNEFSTFDKCSAGGLTCLLDKQARRVGEYDNSVLYNDYVVAKLIRLARARNVASIMYLSDHGESLGENSSFVGHESDVKLADTNDIPMILYIRTDYPVDKAALLQNIDAVWDNGNFYHTMSDLFRIASDYYDLSKSLFKSTYKASPPCS